jgi:hypothetical protein
MGNWQATGQDRERAFRAFEVATLPSLRRALRNGTVWIDHRSAFRSRERTGCSLGLRRSGASVCFRLASVLQPCAVPCDRRGRP